MANRQLAHACMVLWSFALVSHAGTVHLDADGPGDTYELISSVLGGNPIEAPDPLHPEFGRHITEEWDSVLGEYVFAFILHVPYDGDRTERIDRQRNEIKTYDKSPDSLKGQRGDVHLYRWKFKLDSAFQPSPNFCHVHQIKAGDGSDADMPLMTLTPRYKNPEKLQLIFNPSSGDTGGGIKTEADLSLFKGAWVEVYEGAMYDEKGTYSIVITRVKEGDTILAWSSDAIDLWRGDATFNRPKWGIYRSLNDTTYLRDEVVKFADFSISEGAESTPVVGTPISRPTLVAHEDRACVFTIDGRLMRTATRSSTFPPSPRSVTARRQR